MEIGDSLIEIVCIGGVSSRSLQARTPRREASIGPSVLQILPRIIMRPICRHNIIVGPRLRLKTKRVLRYLCGRVLQNLLPIWTALSQQIQKAIADRIGVSVTPRHDHIYLAFLVA